MKAYCAICYILSKPKLGRKCIHFGTELELEPAHPPFRLSLAFQPSQFCSPFVVRGMSHLQLSPNENTQFLYHWLGTAGTGDPDFAVSHTPMTLPIRCEWEWPPPRAERTIVGSGVRGPDTGKVGHDGETIALPLLGPTKPQTQALPEIMPTTESCGTEKPTAFTRNHTRRYGCSSRYTTEAPDASTFLEY